MPPLDDAAVVDSAVASSGLEFPTVKGVFFHHVCSTCYLYSRLSQRSMPHVLTRWSFLMVLSGSVSFAIVSDLVVLTF